MKTSTIRTALTSTIAAALLGGCVGSGDKYPSLAIRDAERISGQFTPAAPVEPQATPPQTLRQLTDFAQQAQEAHRLFLAAQPGAQRLVRSSRNTGIDSDTRSRALIELAGLTSLRSQTAIALSEIDQLKINAETAYEAIGDIDAAQTQAAQLLSQQDAVIDSLAAEMGL